VSKKKQKKNPKRPVDRSVGNNQQGEELGLREGSDMGGNDWKRGGGGREGWGRVEER